MRSKLETWKVHFLTRENTPFSGRWVSQKNWSPSLRFVLSLLMRLSVLRFHVSWKRKVYHVRVVFRFYSKTFTAQNFKGLCRQAQVFEGKPQLRLEVHLMEIKLRGSPHPIPDSLRGLRSSLEICFTQIKFFSCL